MELELQFSSIAEFFRMGQYTFHVWAVYSLFALFMVWNLVAPLWQRRRFLRQQRQVQRRNAQRQAQRNTPASGPVQSGGSQQGRSTSS